MDECEHDWTICGRCRSPGLCKKCNLDSRLVLESQKQRIAELKAKVERLEKFAHELWMKLEGDDQHFKAALEGKQDGA